MPPKNFGSCNVSDLVPIYDISIRFNKFRATPLIPSICVYTSRYYLGRSKALRLFRIIESVPVRLYPVIANNYNGDIQKGTIINAIKHPRGSLP